MSKTFDNIAEASSTNYLFLKAQMTISLAQEPPTPPPLYVLSFPSELVCAAQSAALWVMKSPASEATRTDPGKDTVTTALSVPSLTRGQTSASLRVEATKLKVEATSDNLAEAVTKYVSFHQADVAQEERWRTTMQRKMDQNFRNIKATCEKTNQNFEDLQTTLNALRKDCFQISRIDGRHESRTKAVNVANKHTKKSIGMEAKAVANQGALAKQIKTEDERVEERAQEMAAQTIQAKLRGKKAPKASASNFGGDG